MILPRTLFSYLLKSYLRTLIFVLTSISSCLYIINIFDILNRLRKLIIPLKNLLLLSLMKIPHLLFELYPICIFISLIFFLDKFSKTREILISFVSGVSIWKFMQPFLFASFAISIFMITLFQPMAAYFKNSQMMMEKAIESGNANTYLYDQEGMFIFETLASENRIYTSRYVIPETNSFLHMSILILDKNNKFLKKIEAEKVHLDGNKLNLDGLIFAVNDAGEKIEAPKFLETNLNFKNIMERFSSPENISFWRLGQTSKYLSKFGFQSSEKFVNYYYQILFKPFYALSITIFAFCFITLSQRGSYGFRSLAFGSFFMLMIHGFKEISTKFLLAKDFSNVVSEILPIILIAICSYYYISIRFEKATYTKE